MRILITGASGLLGNKLFEVLSKHNEVAGTYVNNKTNTYVFLDITDKAFVDSCFDKIKPDCVIHAAALANADFCEENKRLTNQVNIEGTRHVVDACKKRNCKLVFVSSDYVFDGNSGPYHEDSKPNPVNYYGLTKLEGEKIVQQNLQDFIIIRPAIMYGYNGNSISKQTFIDKVLNTLRKGEKLVVDNKIIKYPTLIDDVAKAIEKLIQLDAVGVYHVAGKEPVTRYDWALKIAEVFGLPKDNIVAEESKNKAKKPFNVKLDCSKIERFDLQFVDVEKGTKIMKNQEGCMFRMIYSVRPDKLVLNQNTSKFRINVGKLLAKEHPADADMVVPVPESGIYGATGYSAESGIPFFFGMIRDYYTQKTLFEPRQEMRNVSLRKKLIVVPELVKNNKIVLVDEVILSGATLAVVLEKLREAGAKEIHVRIPAPPMVYRCQNKVLNPNAELIALNFDDNKENLEEELRKKLGVDSLRFLSMEGFLNTLSKNSMPCVECFKR